MKTKKLAALSLGILMTMSATACSSNTSDSGSASVGTTAKSETTAKAETTESAETTKAAETPATADPTKMTIILRGGSYASVIKEALPEFEKDNNCTIEVLEMSFDDLHTGIALDAANPTGTYDLCMVDGSWMAEFTENGVLANLSDMGFSFDDDIIPNTTSICKVGDDIYLAPYFGNVTVMMYNKAAIAAAGYAPEDITSCEDLLAVAKSAQESGINGFAYRGDTGDNIVSDFLPILLAHNGWVVDENNMPTVNTPEFIEAMNYYLDLISTGSAMAKDDVTASIDNGSSAVAIGWPGWYVPSADSAANYTVSPVSAKKGGEAYCTSEYGTWTIGIPSNSPNPELAYKLLQYIIDPEVQLESVSNGGVPCRYSCLKNEAVLAEYPHLSTVCDALENGVYRPTIEEWSEFTNILGAEMGNIMAGTKTTEEGLNDAQQLLTDLMS